MQDCKSIGCVNFMSYFENEVFMTVRIRSDRRFPSLNAMIYLSHLDVRNLSQDLSLLYVVTAVIETFCLFQSVQ